MSCPELCRNHGLQGHFDSHRFGILHPDGRELIAHWFRRASGEIGCDPAESFEPFICVWIAFNGWASCCTELDQDRQLVEAVSSNAQLALEFEQMLATSPEIVTIAGQFRNQWPVFKAQELRKRRILTRWQGDRQQTIDYYLKNGATTVSPACAVRHMKADEQIPLDLPHVLSVIYQVRCNLFHGDKAPHSEIDRILVHSAFKILVEFLGRSAHLT